MTRQEWQGVILSHFPGHKRSGNGFVCNCPAHDDKNPSLTIFFKETLDGAKAQIQCRAGCEWSQVLNAAGIDKKLLFYHQNGSKPEFKERKSNTTKEKIFIALDIEHPTAIYSYTDENGQELYQNCRYETDKLGNRLEKKTFRQRHLINNEWAYTLNGLRRVPYNLPALIKEPNIIFDCEGEKDVETLRQIGVTATTTNRECFGELHTFALGKIIIICEDNDEPGRKKAQEKAETYWKLGAECVKIWTFRDLPERADVTDWVQQDPAENDIFKIFSVIDSIAPYNPLQSITITFTRVVTPRKPIVSIDGRNALPSGNIGGLVAGIGQGKSHFAEIIASQAVEPGCDAWSMVEVSLDDSEKVLFVDTEQPGDDCKEILYRIHRRTGQKTSHLTPDHTEFKKLSVLSVIHLDLAERREKLSMAIKRPENRLVIIDGIIDFVANPNDPEETSGFVLWLHMMAAKYDKGIFCILHGNRNDPSGKGKGWLGDVFQRKATCFLMLRKHKLDPTIRVITTNFENAKFRKADDTGLNIAMQWNEDLHGFCCLPYPEEEVEKLTPRMIFEQCFNRAKKVKMKKKELVALYVEVSSKSTQTAYREIDKSVGLFLEKEKMLYSLKVDSD